MGTEIFAGEENTLSFRTSKLGIAVLSLVLAIVLAGLLVDGYIHNLATAAGALV